MSDLMRAFGGADQLRSSISAKYQSDARKAKSAWRWAWAEGAESRDGRRGSTAVPQDGLGEAAGPAVM